MRKTLGAPSLINTFELFPTTNTLRSTIITNMYRLTALICLYIIAGTLALLLSLTFENPAISIPFSTVARMVAEEIITFLIILVVHLLSPLLRVFLSAPNRTSSRILLQDVDLLWQRSYQDRSLGRCIAPDYWFSLGNNRLDSLASDRRPNIVGEFIWSYGWAELRLPVIVSFLTSFAALALLLVLYRLFQWYSGQAPVLGQGSTVNARRSCRSLPAGDTAHSEQEFSPLPPSHRVFIELRTPETPDTRVSPPVRPSSTGASADSPNSFLELPPALIALTHVWEDSQSMATNQEPDYSSGIVPSPATRGVGMAEPSPSMQPAAPVAPTPASAICGRSSPNLAVNSSGGPSNSGNVEPGTSSHESAVPPTSLPLPPSSVNSRVSAASASVGARIVPFPAATASASRPRSGSQADNLAGEPRWRMGRVHGDHATQDVSNNQRASRIPRAQGRRSLSDSGKGKGPESNDWCHR
ncbi:hypothetical protein RhiJN_16517 [Ceratobasidium sp. AG-Ba]|nr:hypothetical protein RhiJN_16517 [Ceratobasidium sp. AG-Ba]